MADVYSSGRSQRDFWIGGHCSLGSIDLKVEAKILYDSTCHIL